MSEVINHPISDVFRFYADNHLQNHRRWDPEMQLSLATDGEVDIGAVFNRRHTHFGDPVEGTMTVIEFERDQAFGLAIDDGFGEFYGRLRFEAIGESATQHHWSMCPECQKPQIVLFCGQSQRDGSTTPRISSDLTQSVPPEQPRICADMGGLSPIGDHPTCESAVVAVGVLEIRCDQIASLA